MTIILFSYENQHWNLTLLYHAIDQCKPRCGLLINADYSHSGIPGSIPCADRQIKLVVGPALQPDKIDSLNGSTNKGSVYHRTMLSNTKKY